ncbi:hypothetical protein KFK09_004600 [Dendrobium nobile]|uniref:Retrovirus-related Pol polyprotein from transposon TNT 1-94-like beta-barrel domain-containing protein n=1 Tax=Dendrobium nobile TaxID=94219 RepID=A0A8T3C6P1_DENNO|nr:hypothetical protein KFK09_004600 [Dendrobium nobile]
MEFSKLLRANGFEKFLDPLTPIPEERCKKSDNSIATNPKYTHWLLTDQNLAAALCSTISQTVLPYVIHLDSTSKIWATLETRFQATNRSKVIQLKNELHNISMKTSTMTQYLTEIKSIVDQIAAAGSVVDTEDVILYILNGLPPPYQAFKTAIRTMITPISLDNLYPLLLSEEVNIAHDSARINAPADPNLALYSSRGRGKKQQGRSVNNALPSTRSSSDKGMICQICHKKGHNATNCWHRLNMQYTPSARNRALAATQDPPSTNWFLDSGASSHLTNSLENLSLENPYTGAENVTIGDGRSIPVAHSGSGLLKINGCKLNLDQILHTP